MTKDKIRKLILIFSTLFSSVYYIWRSNAIRKIKTLYAAPDFLLKNDGGGWSLYYRVFIVFFVAMAIGGFIYLFIDKIQLREEMQIKLKKYHKLINIISGILLVLLLIYLGCILSQIYLGMKMSYYIFLMICQHTIVYAILCFASTFVIYDYIEVLTRK